MSTGIETGLQVGHTSLLRFGQHSEKMCANYVQGRNVIHMGAICLKLFKKKAKGGRVIPFCYQVSGINHTRFMSWTQHKVRMLRRFYALNFFFVCPVWNLYWMLHNCKHSSAVAGNFNPWVIWRPAFYIEWMLMKSGDLMLLPTRTKIYVVTFQVFHLTAWLSIHLPV